MSPHQHLPLLSRGPSSNLHPAHVDYEVLKVGRATGPMVKVTSFGLEKRVVKDFANVPWAVRCTLGRFLIYREWRTLCRLHHMVGVPANPTRLGPYALSYQFVTGETLSALRSRKAVIEADFFYALEHLVDELHARGFVHLDLRNGKNVLRTETGQPHLLDFQSGMWTGPTPTWLRRRLQAVDRSGIYKWWNRLSPHTLNSSRAAVLRNVNRQRQHWPFNYPQNDDRLRD